jgi:hypothetical protein
VFENFVNKSFAEVLEQIIPAKRAKASCQEKTSRYDNLLFLTTFFEVYFFDPFKLALVDMPHSQKVCPWIYQSFSLHSDLHMHEKECIEIKIKNNFLIFTCNILLNITSLSLKENCIKKVKICIKYE